MKRKSAFPWPQSRARSSTPPDAAVQAWDRHKSRCDRQAGQPQANPGPSAATFSSLPKADPNVPEAQYVELNSGYHTPPPRCIDRNLAHGLGGDPLEVQRGLRPNSGALASFSQASLTRVVGLSVAFASLRFTAEARRRSSS
jgi:hypothetical protein